MNDDEFTTAERLEVLKAVWPDECALIGDYQLSRIASGEVTVTRPEVGEHFDISPITDIIKAASALLTVFATYWAARASSKQDVSQKQPPKQLTEEELLEYSRSFIATQTELDTTTVTLIAREYIIIKKRKTSA